MESNEKITRVFKILEILSKKKLSTSEIYEKLIDEDFIVDKRTVQRDLKFLKESEYIRPYSEKKSLWEVVYKNSNLDLPITVSGSEFLSFCILKNYIRNFKGTQIEDDINKLELVLEKFTNEMEIEDDIIFWDQTFGNYDYSGHSRNLNQILKHIVNNDVIELSYLSNPLIEKDKIKTITVVPLSLFYYNGTIYLIAYYVKRKTYLNFTLQFITQIKQIASDNVTIPKLDISSFKAHKFGVFDGDIKDVKLIINKSFRKYFENRNWHPTQKIHINPNTGELIIEMKVPISYELISWIMGWGDAITIEYPSVLIDKIKERTKLLAEKYKII